MSKPRIVFDIDDTICYNMNRDYENSIPFKFVIKKINMLHDILGFEIILYTARGMISCNGNLDKIINKNKEVLEKWLLKNNVHYDELIFGKPIADLYVDDKGMNLEEFICTDFYELNGGSGKSTYRIGNLVKKDLGSNEKLLNFQKWVKEVDGVCNIPKIISYTYNEVYMAYINGQNLSFCFDTRDLLDIVEVILKFGRKKKNNFDINVLFNFLDKDIGFDKEIDEMIEVCKIKISEYEDDLIMNASLCHGDLTLSNIVKSKENILYFIDSLYDDRASSYLLDFAKLRMSLRGYENIFCNSFNNYKKHLNEFDSFLRNMNVKNIVIILELMHILRLTRYKEKNEICKVKSFAKELIAENEKLFGTKQNK